MKIKATVSVNSNLGFTTEMTADVEILEKEYAKIAFSTGFVADATFVSTHNDVDVYAYISKYSHNMHYLHIRKDGDKLFCQTLQTCLEPGGSTFIVDIKSEANHDGIITKSWYLTSRGHYVYIGDVHTTSKNGNINMYKGELFVFKNTNEVVINPDTSQTWFHANELKTRVDIKSIPKLVGIIKKLKVGLL